MSTLDDTEEFATGLLAGSGNDSHRLLQYLHAIQLRYSCVPAQLVDQLATSLGLTEAHIRSVIGFYAFLHETPRGDYDVLFSDNITDEMLGNRQLFDALCQALNVEPGVPRADGRVTVATTSCTGMCDQGPAMLINGMAVTRLDSTRVAIIADLIERRVALDAWPDEFFEVVDNIRRSDLLLAASLDGGAALDALARQGAVPMLDVIETSGLRGRGGAGFATAMKWKLCRGAAADGHNRVVVCNADEGEPGTFKDRVLLDSFADDVFEGMTLCAGIIGANEGYLYLRGEYLYMRDRLEQVLEQRRERGLLGKAIRGQQGFDFDISIHVGAGAYICGEESALIESLEGKRGIPRIRPPFPVTEGYRGRPTVVNNVETFLAAARIAVGGADWFRSAGTAQSAGTRLLSISGDCARPGIYEFAFGTPIADILAACGAEDTQAVQVSGAAGNTIPAAEFDRCIAFEDVSTGGSFMVFDRQRDLLDMVRNFSHFFVHESCGFCTPCRVGTALVRDLVDKLHAGHAGAYDVEELRYIGKLMKLSSHCGLGTTASTALLDVLDKFAGSYESRLTSREYEPAFDLDASLQEARVITGREDAGAHIRTDA